MRLPIVGVRRFSQAFFLVLFLWFCLVPLPVGPDGSAKGWPVNWLLQLDPLVGLGTLLTTGTLYRGLLWGVATLALTVVLGRFFCGWLCPFGTLHQAIGWLGRRRKTAAARIRANTYRRVQSVKYLLLAVLLGMASGPLAARAWAAGLSAGQRAGWILAALGLLALAGLSLRRDRVPGVTARILAGAAALAGLGLGWAKPVGAFFAGSLQTGLLDPLPLMHRTFQLVFLPALSRAGGADALPRFYTGAGLLGALFLLFLALNLWIPRFYCRFLCPLGALFGTLAPVQFLRVGKTADACSHCKRCETDCEGGCEPDGRIRSSECVLCMNCLHACPDDVIDYRTTPSASGEESRPDTDRRHVLVSLAAGLAAIPVARISGLLGDNWNPKVIRPPGALREDLLLNRCIQCGQCMRVCPTGIIQPAGLETGAEGLWTPVLNFRIGSSGCQLACTACGHACPTAAIRPLTLDEKHGTGTFRDRGPIRCGTAFVDRGRCLPWAMNRPCIVCQENCPVSPKAITLREEWQAIGAGRITVQSADRNGVWTREPLARTGDWDSGDYFASFPSLGAARRRITQAAGNRIELEDSGAGAPLPAPGTDLEVSIRLLLPVVDPARCIGCGICEHECPVSGLRAIRVTAENESRNRAHSLLPSKG
jgi:polyferredoxin